MPIESILRQLMDEQDIHVSVDINSSAASAVVNGLLVTQVANEGDGNAIQTVADILLDHIVEHYPKTRLAINTTLYRKFNGR